MYKLFRGFHITSYRLTNGKSIEDFKKDLRTLADSVRQVVAKSDRLKDYEERITDALKLAEHSIDDAAKALAKLMREAVEELGYKKKPD